MPLASLAWGISTGMMVPLAGRHCGVLDHGVFGLGMGGVAYSGPGDGLAKSPSGDFIKDCTAFVT